MPRTHGDAMKGQRCDAQHDGGAKGRANAIGALIQSTWVAIGLVSCSVDTAVFTAWTEPILLPNIPEKSAIVMDNATFHQGQDMQNMIEDSGYTLLYLPPYSPDLNPSETTWAHAQHIRGTTNGSLNELFTRYSL